MCLLLFAVLKTASFTRAWPSSQVARLRAEQYRRDSIASFGSAASDDAEALLRDYEKRREELAAFTIQRCLTAKVGVRVSGMWGVVPAGLTTRCCIACL